MCGAKFLMPNEVPVSSAKFLLCGKVVKGLGSGKKLGFPTINLEIKSIPPELDFGVYAVKAKISVRVFDGVAHYGPRSFHKAPASFEIHCLDFNKNVYGKKVEVAILKKIRGVKKFKTESALKKQIERDVAKATVILNLFQDLDAEINSA